MSDRNPAQDRGVVVRRGPVLLLRQQLRRMFAIRYFYENVLERQRAVALAAMCLIFGVLGAGGTIGMTIVVPHVAPQTMLVPNIALSLAYLLLYREVQRGNLRWASRLFVVLAVLVPVLQYALFQFISPEAVYLSLAVPVVSASLLVGPVWAFPAAAVVLAASAAVTYYEYVQQTEAVEHTVSAAIIAAFLLSVLSLFSWLLSRSLFAWAESSQRRARQLEAAAVIAETSATAPSLNALLNVVVERIRDAFGFYHAQVFLLDTEGRMARLEASTGRAGVALLARGHGLRVGSQSVIGQCTFLGTPIVVNDTLLSNVWRPNELLPETRAELALPLMVGHTTIGALDVQSSVPNVYQPEDIRSLQIMAQQLATTIEKTRLLDALQARAAENQRLFEEAQASLQQIEELNRRLTREGWSEYLQARSTAGTVGYTLADADVEMDTSWTAPMRQAYQGEHSVVIQQDQHAHIAAVPLRVRGEVIGVLEVERGGDRPWSDEELEMAETLVDRLALAVENARLYEQATQASEREHVINKIAQDVQAAQTIDEILQSALMELGTVLGAKRGVVQISPKVQSPAARTGHTGPLPEMGA